MAGSNDPGVPFNCDLERRRGDTWPLPIQLLQKGTTTPLTDVTGYTFLLSVDTEKDPTGSTSSATNLFEVTGTIDDGPNAQISFHLTDAQANQAIGTYFYEVEWTDTAGDRRTLMEGKWVVKQDRAKGA